MLLRDDSTYPCTVETAINLSWPTRLNDPSYPPPGLTDWCPDTLNTHGSLGCVFIKLLFLIVFVSVIVSVVKYYINW